ncbi:transketolase [Methylobacterium sp. 174MFSha1.1]|uniref:transketolase family protein n=1 Tax=Methylobacterium sp. 174MFSha1.1 TaxID=1502749 RepID=UPI0008E2A89A|nr:transketolase C-terminal domain-containing protein [Methylobacterium sp. 174MFSha1.1]SFU75575.1 transketolase [Methylobacterium sp. 174MFSha1.1]
MSLLDHPDRLHEHVAVFRAAHPRADIRARFGASVTALLDRRPDAVAVTADLMHATGLAGLKERHPDRLINVGIAEQNLTGVAAGLAACGKLPVVCGYAAFLTLRAVEQAKVDCAYNELKVILCGLASGLSYGVGGPTHQTYEDVAIMRAIPNMVVVAPSDPVELDHALQAAAEHPAGTPIYLRLGRGPEHVVTRPGDPFAIGRAARLTEGRDVCLVAHGAMVMEALLAADLLRAEGIAAEVLNMHTVKPIDREAILAAADHVRAMVVVEEHSVIGGLGAAVLEVLERGHAFPVLRIGIEDAYPPIGPTPELREALGLSGPRIAARVRDLL